jgi:hypothetical protein
MNAKFVKWLLTGVFGLLAACAIITVNVYFPEKAAKEAYKSLDDMLLTNKGEKPSTEGKQPAEEQKSPAAPEAKPQSNLFQQLPSFSLVAVANASDKLPDNRNAQGEADALAIEIASMPEVVKAYEEMNHRLPRLRILFNSGVVGLTNQGLITVRDKSKVTPQDEVQVTAENQDRKTVITGMAKAILKQAKQKETKAALNQVLAKAAATFADAKRESASPGWWMQLQNGRWVQK